MSPLRAVRQRGPTAPPSTFSLPSTGTATGGGPCFTQSTGLMPTPTWAPRPHHADVYSYHLRALPRHPDLQASGEGTARPAPLPTPPERQNVSAGRTQREDRSEPHPQGCTGSHCRRRDQARALDTAELGDLRENPFTGRNTEARRGEETCQAPSDKWRVSGSTRTRAKRRLWAP